MEKVKEQIMKTHNVYTVHQRKPSFLHRIDSVINIYSNFDAVVYSVQAKNYSTYGPYRHKADSIIHGHSSQSIWISGQMQ
jgi:hypothetical protein